MKRAYDQNGIARYFACTLVVRQLTSAWLMWELNQEIRSGSLSPKLLKPVNPLWGSALQMAAAAMVYAERKVAARLQQRFGPTYTGPLGLLQPFADVAKLLFKEELRPKSADAILFYLAPVISVTTAFLAFAGLAVWLAAAALVRPLALGPLLRRAGGAVSATPRRPVLRAVRAAVGLVAGVLIVLHPRAAVEVVVVRQERRAQISRGSSSSAMMSAHRPVIRRAVFTPSTTAARSSIAPLPSSK